MNIELSKSEILIILDSLLKNHLDAKIACSSSSYEVDPASIKPKEFQKVYNKILVEAQENGLCSSLDTLGNSIN